MPVLAINPKGEAEQIARLRAVRAQRDQTGATAARTALVAAAHAGTNLMPPILDCVRAEVTLGEIAGDLRTVFGEYREPGLAT